MVVCTCFNCDAFFDVSAPNQATMQEAVSLQPFMVKVQNNELSKKVHFPCKILSDCDAIENNGLVE